MANVLSRKFFNQFDNGVNLDQNLSTKIDYTWKGYAGGKYKVVREIEFQVKSEPELLLGSNFVVTPSGNTITRDDSGNFKTDGFQLGDSIVVNHNGAAATLSTTISGLTSTKIITADNFPSDATESTIIYLNTKLRGFEIFENLIENNEAENFIDKVDGESIRKYVGELTEAEYDAGTEINLSASGVRNSWKGDTMTASCTQQLSAGNNYTQKHEITQIFETVPWVGSIANLENGVLPEYFEQDLCLRSIQKIVAKDDMSNPLDRLVIDDSDSDTIANTGWYDEHFNDFSPVEFALGETNLTVDGNSVTAINADETTRFEIKINSLNSLLVDGNTKFHINILYLNQSIDSTKTRQYNFIFDRVFGTADGSIITSENGILINVAGSVVDGQLVVTGDIEYNLTQQGLLTGGKYLITVATNDYTKDFRDSLPMNLICDVNTYQIAEVDPQAVEIRDPYFYEHPYDIGSDAKKTDFRGWVEDGILYNPLIRIRKADSYYLTNLKIKLVAFFDDDNFFEIENREFDVSENPRVGNVTQIDIDTTRGFLLAEDSQFNFVKIDTGTIGDESATSTIQVVDYNVKYAYKIRWEDWRVLQDAAQEFYDNSQLNDGLNYRISNYSSVNGYTIKVLIETTVTDGANTTTYRDKSPDIDVYYYDEDQFFSPLWEQTKWTFNQENVQLSESISINENLTLLGNENTKVRIRFTATEGSVEDTEIYGVVRLEEYLNGGITGIYELSSTRESISYNPLIPLSGESYTKVTITSAYIELDCQIDYTKLAKGRTYKLSGRLGSECIDIPEVRAEAELYQNTGQRLMITNPLSKIQLREANLGGTNTVIWTGSKDWTLDELITLLNNNTSVGCKFEESSVNAGKINIIAPPGFGANGNKLVSLYLTAHSVTNDNTILAGGTDATSCDIIKDVENYKLLEDGTAKIIEGFTSEIKYID